MHEKILGEFISELAKVLKIEKGDIKPETKLKADLNIKSMEMVFIISYFEDEYDIYLKYTDLAKAETVEEAVKVVQEIIEG